MKRGPKTVKRETDQFVGYPTWRKAERADKLARCFVIIPLAAIVAICGRNSVVKVGVALHCQAVMQGRKNKIIPYASWRTALGVPKRAYFRAITILEKNKLIRRHRKGPGRKSLIELRGALALFAPKGRDRTVIPDPAYTKS